MQLTIEVTEEDIREGARCDGDCCPVALAMRRATPGLPWWVAGGYAKPFGFDEGSYVSLPNGVAEFVSKLHIGDPVQPFTFTVDIPKELESYIKVPA